MLVEEFQEPAVGGHVARSTGDAAVDAALLHPLEMRLSNRPGEETFHDDRLILRRWTLRASSIGDHGPREHARRGDSRQQLAPIHVMDLDQIRLWKAPAFMMTESAAPSRSRSVRLASGSPSTRIRSAMAPAFTTPIRSFQPRICAFTDV